MDSFRSWRTVLIACVAILAITVAIGGCFGGISGAVIKGCVTEIDLENALRFEAGLLSSGPGVSGAKVTLVGPESHVTTTDSLGRFTFANVSPGTYDMTVWKSGFASATAYNVRVASYRTNEVELRMVKPREGSTIYETNPPTVDVLCQSPVVETGNIIVSANDTSGIAGILLFIDNSYVELFDTGAGGSYMSGRYPWNTLSGQSVADNGEHTITAMAIDGYGNIGHMSIIVTVDNIGQPDPIPQTPTNPKAGAVTVHYSVFDLVHQLETNYILGTFSSLANEILALAKSIQETDSQIRPLAMPAGSNAVTYCRVSWENSDTSVKGFKIYRDGVFIGESPAQSSGTRAQLIQPRPPDPPEIGSYIDGSSKLTPNVPISYRVSAYNSWGEGNKSASVTTTPLNALSEVTVVEPIMPAIVPIPDNYPWFEWITVPNAKLYLIDVIRADGVIMWHGYAYGHENRVRYGDDNHTIPDGQNWSLTQGQYYFYITAINSRENPPMPSGFAAWSPKEISISSSKLGRFKIVE
jgi:hypothetical protein